MCTAKVRAPVQTRAQELMTRRVGPAHSTDGDIGGPLQETCTQLPFNTLSQGRAQRDSTSQAQVPAAAGARHGAQRASGKEPPPADAPAQRAQPFSDKPAAGLAADATPASALPPAAGDAAIVPREPGCSAEGAAPALVGCSAGKHQPQQQQQQQKAGAQPAKMAGGWGAWAAYAAAVEPQPRQQQGSRACVDSSAEYPGSPVGEDGGTARASPECTHTPRARDLRSAPSPGAGAAAEAAASAQATAPSKDAPAAARQQQFQQPSASQAAARPPGTAQSGAGRQQQDEQAAEPAQALQPPAAAAQERRRHMSAGGVGGAGSPALTEPAAAPAAGPAIAMDWSACNGETPANYSTAGGGDACAVGSKRKRPMVVAPLLTPCTCHRWQHRESSLTPPGHYM